MKKSEVKKGEKSSSKNTTKSVRVRAWDVTTKLNIVLRKYYNEDQMCLLKPLIQSYSLDVVLLGDFKKRLSADDLVVSESTKYGTKYVVSADFKAYQELLKNLHSDIDMFKKLFAEKSDGKSPKEARDLDSFLNDFDEKEGGKTQA